MRRRDSLVVFGAVLVGATTARLSVGQEDWVLHEGTPIRMKINRTVSSAKEKQGDSVDFETLDDIKVNDLLVIPKGSIAMGTVTEAEAKRSMGRAGKLNVNIDFVRLPSGDKLPLRGIQETKGGGHVGAMTGAIVATSIVFFPAAPLFLFMKGKDITIPKGHEITVYVNSDLKVAKPLANRNGTDSPLLNRTGSEITNADVISLKGAGLSEQVIIDKIKSSRTRFSLDTADILALKSAGLSDSVISAMLAANH